MAKRRVGRYPKEFRRMVVERLKSCDNIVALAQELGLLVDIVRLILSQAMQPITLGLTIGLGSSLLQAPMLTALLFGVRPFDMLTLASVLFGLFGVAVIACYVPARRASSVDPMLALRCE